MQSKMQRKIILKMHYNSTQPEVEIEKVFKITLV